MTVSAESTVEAPEQEILQHDPPMGQLIILLRKSVAGCVDPETEGRGRREGIPLNMVNGQCEDRKAIASPEGLVGRIGFMIILGQKLF